MIASGFVGLGAGLLPRARGKAEIAWLCGWGFISAFIYGWLMDFAFWPFNLGTSTQLSFDPHASPLTNLWHFVLFNVATSMGWNLGRALTNVICLALLGGPILQVLRRASRRAQFGASTAELAPQLTTPE